MNCLLMNNVLSKGGNFAIVPAKLPVGEIIANVESGIRSLPIQTAEHIREKTSRILQRAKPPKSNLTFGERTALKTLNQDREILVLPADKGNATVIISTTDHERKIETFLDPITYKKLPRDPTGRILKTTNQLIKDSTIFAAEDISKLKKTEALPPRLYGLPKILKTDVPLRPIVSAIGGPTYQIAKYLTTLLQPKIGTTNSFIKDSAHFVDKLHALTLSPGDVLVSFDVVSLFTMVPIKTAMEQIERDFLLDIAKFFRHCLTTTYF